MKYVYVLTSTKNDLYYEQALMSVWSLRYHMKDAEVIVLVDNKTKESFKDEKRAELKELAQIISVDFDDSVSNVERSRLIKTTKSLSLMLLSIILYCVLLKSFPKNFPKNVKKSPKTIFHLPKTSNLGKFLRQFIR